MFFPRCPYWLKSAGPLMVSVLFNGRARIVCRECRIKTLYVLRTLRVYTRPTGGVYPTTEFETLLTYALCVGRTGVPYAEVVWTAPIRHLLKKKKKYYTPRASAPDIERRSHTSVRRVCLAPTCRAYTYRRYDNYRITSACTAADDRHR